MTSKYNQTYTHPRYAEDDFVEMAGDCEILTPTLTTFRGKTKEWKEYHDKWCEKQLTHPFHHSGQFTTISPNIINTEKLNLILKDIKKNKKIKTIVVFDGCYGNHFIFPNLAVERSFPELNGLRHIQGSVLVRYA